MVRRKSDNPSRATPTKLKRRFLRVGNQERSVSVRVLREIKRAQLTTDMLVPKAPFQRLVREIIDETTVRPDKMIQRAALEALQEAAEIYVVQVFEHAQLCAHHAKRVTLKPEDMHLVFTIRGSNDVYNH